MEADKATFEKAVTALREVLGPGSKVLAAQDFRHTSQNEGESVSAFIRRLERTFSIAYGADKLSPETRGAFLYGQLQEGLRHQLMRSPSVSGALTRSLSWLLKTRKRDNRSSRNGSSISTHLSHKHSGTAPPKKSTNVRTDHSKSPSSEEHTTKLRCHNCRKIGHMKRDCPYKTESTGNRQHAARNPSSMVAK